MNDDLTIATAWTGLAVRGLEGLEVDVRAACVAGGLDYDLLTTPDIRVPVDCWVRLWRAVRARSADPYLGLHAAEAAPLAANHILAMASMSASSLLEAVRQHVHLQRLLAHQQVLSVRTGGTTTTFALTPVAAEPGVRRHGVEYTLAYVFRFWRHFMYPDLRPLRVVFSHPWPPSSVEHERLFGCPVDFAQRQDGLVFATAMIARPRPSFSPQTYAELRRRADQAVADLAEPSHAGRTRGVLRGRLGSGLADIGAVSRAMGMSARTLQRHLAAEGTSYQVVLDSARRAAALEALAGGGDLRAAAAAAGFAAEPSFWRAFKRWTGQTPAAFIGAQRANAVERSSSAGRS